MISDKLEQAKQNPDKDYHLKMDIRRVLRVIESERDYSDTVDEELEALPEDHPITELVQSIEVWESSEHQDFENGMDSLLTALDDLYELALENEWYSVASYSLLKSVEYRESLGGFDPTTQFDTLLEFLHNRFYGESEVHLGQLGTHVRKMLEHLDSMDCENIDLLLDLVKDRANQLRKNKNYSTERDYLEYQITIKEHSGEDVSTEQSRMIESYEDELEQKNPRKAW